MSVTCPTGQVLRDDEGMRLEYVRSFAAGVDEVWAAITDPALLGRWFGTWTGDPADGSVALRMLEGGDAVAIAIRECAAPVRLAITIPNGGDAWPLQLSLEGDGARSTLVFTHRLAEPYDATNIGPGWHYYLDRLGAVVAGSPVPDDFADYHPALAPAYGLPG